MLSSRPGQLAKSKSNSEQTEDGPHREIGAGRSVSRWTAYVEASETSGRGFGLGASPNTER